MPLLGLSLKGFKIMPTMVYEYGLLPPNTDRNQIDRQFRLAHQYYNKLVEIERWRRDEIAKIQLIGNVINFQNQIDVLNQKKLEVQEQIKNERKISRSTKTNQDLRREVQKISGEIKDLRSSLKEEKRKQREDQQILDKFAETNNQANNRVKEARKHFSKTEGLYWGTYLLIEQSIDQARKTSIEPPRFKRWDGEGSIGVQIQKGLPGENVFSENPHLRIEPVPPETFDKNTPRGERRRFSRTKVHFRIGSTNGKPIWAEFPLVFHRPLPEGAEIKWAKIVMRKHANWTRYYLQLTINIPESNIVRIDTKKVAIDLGWRQMDDGSIRVAYWTDEDGKNGELRLPSSIPERLEFADSLRSIRDKNLDAFKEDIKPFLSSVSKELMPETSPLLWRSPGKLSGDPC